MDLNTNAWNRARYTLWAPLYDLAGRRFDGRRRASLQLLDLKPRERLLIVGAGTGADLPYVPPGLSVVATDLTPAMLRRGRRHLRSGAHLALMDGHRLGFGRGTIDAVALHLILAVIPDPVRCLQEVARVLRPGGRVAVFDKFAKTTTPSFGLRALNLLTAPLFTEVTRCFEDILEGSNASLAVEHDIPAWKGGLFRHVILRKDK
jgi:ubiquinone/menaquinone biosynthesis C-methylase UbiE